MCSNVSYYCNKINFDCLVTETRQSLSKLYCIHVGLVVKYNVV